MKTFSIAALILGTTWVLACGKSSDARDRGPGPAGPKQSEAADGAPGGRMSPASNASRLQAPSSQTPAANTRDICGLLSASEIAEVTGVAVERVEKKPNGCDWYANPAAQREKGADTVRGTFAGLMKQEPKSDAETARSMEDMLKGMTRAASPDKPLFAVSIEWQNADQAEATVKTTMGVLGGGLQGGRLEPIDGLGDRAYAGSADVVFYVRKGAAFVTLGSLGTREQTIALARKLVARL